jgi:hypothetical protein
MKSILKKEKMRLENQTETRDWEDSSLCPETSTKNAVQEFHRRRGTFKQHYGGAVKKKLGYSTFFYVSLGCGRHRVRSTPNVTNTQKQFHFSTAPPLYQLLSADVIPVNFGSFLKQQDLA